MQQDRAEHLVFLEDSLKREAEGVAELPELARLGENGGIARDFDASVAYRSQ